MAVFLIRETSIFKILGGKMGESVPFGLDIEVDIPDTTCVRQTQHTTPTTPNQGSETMPKVMNHSEYMKKTRTMDESSLRHVIKECKEVIELQSSFNENVGYYMDEIHYCCMELNRREKLGK